MGIQSFPDHAELERLLTDSCARHRVPGAVVGISAAGSTVTAAAGVANVHTGEPMTVDTVSQIASVTKVFTSTTLMSLLDERGIGLDTPIGSLLPELPGLPDTITVRRLLDHTSGLESDLWDDFGANSDAIARYTAAIPGLGTVGLPGEFFSYCNTGYVALGRLVEVLGGSSFDRVLDRRLIRPLGLPRTTTRLVDAVQHRLALGHDLHPDGVVRTRPWIDIRALMPTGGVVTTVPDLLRLGELHLADGGDILSPSTALAMRTQSSTCGEPWTAGPGWGLGLTVCTGPDGEPVFGHDGLWIGAGAYLRVIPRHRVAIALLGAAGHARTVWQDVYGELLTRLGMQQPLVPAPAESGGPALDVAVERYVGAYRRLSQDYEVVERDGSLWLTTTPTGPVAGVSAPSTVQLRWVSDDAFAARASTGVDMPVVFRRADDGRASHLYTGMRAAPRVAVSS